MRPQGTDRGSARGSMNEQGTPRPESMPPMQDPRKITVQGIFDRSPLPGRSQSADSAGLKDSRKAAPVTRLRSSRAICVALVGASDATGVRVHGVATAHDWLLYDYPDQIDAAMLMSRRRPNILFLALSKIHTSSDLLGKLKRGAPGLTVIVLGRYGTVGEIVGSMMGGADGYIVAAPPWEHFEKAIVNAAEGSALFCKQAQEALLRHVQYEVARLVTLGLSAAERSIAADLLQTKQM